MGDVNETTEFLPTTAYAVLGLLSFGEGLSGYELRQRALGSLRFFYWSPAQSQIYRELRRLEAQGFVAPQRVEQQDRPDKTVYRLTTSGRSELVRWIESSPIDPPVIKHPAALRLFFGHVVSGERRHEILSNHMDNVEDVLGELEALTVGLDDHERVQLARAVSGWAVSIYRGDLRGAGAVASALDADPVSMR